MSHIFFHLTSTGILIKTERKKFIFLLIFISLIPQCTFHLYTYHENNENVILIKTKREEDIIHRTAFEWKMYFLMSVGWDS